MKRFPWFALLLLMLGAIPAAAQPMRSPAPSAPAEAGPIRPQPLSLQAGTGLLLHLPQPAAAVMSADPGIARVQPASPTSLFVMGAAAGRTTIIATSDSGTPIVQYDVTVSGSVPGQAGPGAFGAQAPGTEGPAAAPQIDADTTAALQTTIQRLVPGGGSVTAHAAGSRVVLTGTVPNPSAAEAAVAIARGFAGEKSVVISELSVLSSIQVNVRVRIAEIDRTITRQLGFNWQALGAGGKWRFGMLTGAAASANTTATGVGLPAGLAATAGLPAAALSPLIPLGLTPFQDAPTAPFQVGAGFTTGQMDINGIIDALAADQLITILAEPNLTAESGEPASFLAGGEFPVPVGSSTGSGTTSITVDFKQYGISLEVVPTVLSPTRLNLRVKPEVSQLTSTGAVSVPIAGGTLTIPALTVRRAETTVELGSGQSFAIAGLLQKNTTDVTSALPGIGELPVIGALFKSNSFQRGESELVIIVTPYLVKPAPSPSALHAPTDGFRPATDLDRILLGRQLAPPPGGAPLDAGFIVK